MCGRYIVTSPIDALRRRFGFQGDEPGYRPRFNLAPRQPAPVIVEKEGGRLLRMMTWGLVPSWTKDLSRAARPINARAETAATLLSFRDSFESGRVLVPAEGFLEWRGVKGRSGRTPILFRMRSRAPFAFAGLAERWVSEDGTALQTFAILTVPPNELVGRVHDRMPAILRREDEGTWLDPRSSRDRVRRLLAPPAASDMEAFELGPAINSWANDEPDLVEPIAPLR